MSTFNPYLETHSIEKYKFLHHFLPHPETKKRAKLLRLEALFIYVLVVGLFGLFLHLLPKVAPGILGYASDITIRDLLSETNQIRNEHGLKSLKVNPILSTAAKAKAEHMFQNGYWAHNAPDGTTPWDFILEAGYDYKYAGENLAKNFTTSRGVVEAWYKSPSHKENLLNKDYDEIGFAVVDGVLDGYETTLVVQMFGKSRVAPVVVAKQPQSYAVDEVPAKQVEVAPAIGEEVASERTGLDTPKEPIVDVTTATRVLTLGLSSFLFILLALDIWYTKKKAIPKITANAYAHILFLIVTVVGLWFALMPGEVL